MKYGDIVQIVGDSFFDGKRGRLLDYRLVVVSYINDQGALDSEDKKEFLVSFGRIQKWFMESKIILAK